MVHPSPLRSALFRSTARSAVVAVLGAAVLAPVAAVADELPLKRVVLSSAGLAQFTHAGTAAAGSSIDLPVRLDQVDDVLKSLTVFDEAGAVGPVSLPGREPLDQLFRDLPFDRSALASPVDLVNALAGAEIEIAGPVVAKGRVFRVENEAVTGPDGRATTVRHRLSLLTDKGLVQAIFEDVTALSFTDPKAKAQIDRALAGLAENRAKDRRTLSVGVLGSGSRRMAVAYVVAAPIWKTSWRLVLPDVKADGAAKTKARLQGWAILENLTGGDWKDVDLTLTSGNPVALTQPLYTAVYGNRVRIPVVSSSANIAPPSDSGVVAAEAMPGKLRAAGGANRAMSKAAEPQFMGAPAPAMAPPPPPPPPMAPAGVAAEARDAATQLVYRFPTPVTVETGHSLMLPFVDREVTAERVWIYRPSSDPRHPLAALKIVNDSANALPSGVVTAFETADGRLDHVGDAVLPLIGRGETKFVSFALDAKTTIRREDKGTKVTTLGTLADGVLTTTAKSRRTIVYEVTPPADEAREIVVEEGRIDGWAPAAKEGVEDTPSHHRIRISAAKGAVAKAEFVTEHVDTEAMTLGDIEPEVVLAQIRGLDNASPALKAAVERLATVVADIARADGQRQRNDEERQRITTDQQRIRANLGSVGAATDLGRRYVEQLRQQENRLDELTRSDQASSDAAAARRKDARDIIRGLKL